MKIGDIEFTQSVNLTNAVGNAGEFATIQFAVGLKIRPLMTRVDVHPLGATVATGGQGVWFENGEIVGEGDSLATMRSNLLLLPVWTSDIAIATSGIAQVVSFESLWWKILQPQIRFHGVSVTTGVLDVRVVMHYRFAELTPDEVIEIAAQRGT